MTGLEKTIGYSFANKDLLKTALTHRSYVNEAKSSGIVCAHNERLEFFGDAIIEFFISEYIYLKYPDLPEGSMTRMRSSMVCEKSLSVCAAELDLGSYLYMGKGEEQSGGRERASITSDAFEALCAAVYLDSGRAETEKFLYEHLITALEKKDLFFDAKTRLQEIVQKTEGNVLRYELISETGPAHDKTFEAAALLNDVEVGRGRGSSKKAAQQQAAVCAIENLKKM